MLDVVDNALEVVFSLWEYALGLFNGIDEALEVVLPFVRTCNWIGGCWRGLRDS